MGFAQIQIVGNLGSDPEMKYSPEGQARTTFSVAVSHSRPNRQAGGWDEETDWFRCTVWGKQAESVAERLRKGSKVAIAGRFKSRQWHSEQSGKSDRALEINVDQWTNLTPREQANDGYAGGYGDSFPDAGPAAAPVSGNADIDDLPF